MKILKYYSTILELEKEIKLSQEYKDSELGETDIFEEGYQAGLKYALNKFKNEVN